MDNKKTRLYEKSSYSSRTISIYQIVGAYLVDTYYNHLYTEAIKFKNSGKASSVTEGYRHATFAYLSALDNKYKKSYRPEQYNTLLIGINEYFIKWTSFNSLTLSECMDKIVREFVPDDYYKSLDNDQKRNILRTVLINIIRGFTKIVIEEYLQAIIDNHEELANIEVMKESIVNLFIDEREKMFHKFLDSYSSTSQDKVDRRFAEKMKAEIIKLNEEKLLMLDVIKTQQSEIDTRKEQLTKLLAKYRKLENNHKNILAEYQISKEKADELEEQYRINREELALQKESLFYSDIKPDQEEVNSAFMDVEDSLPVLPDIPKTALKSTQAKPVQKTTQAKPLPKSVQKSAQAKLPPKPIQKSAQVKTAPKPPQKPVQKSKLTPTSSDMDKLIDIHSVKPALNKPDNSKSRYVQLTVDKNNEEEDTENETEEESDKDAQSPMPIQKPSEPVIDKTEESNIVENPDIDVDTDQENKSSLKTELGSVPKISDIY